MPVKIAGDDSLIPAYPGVEGDDYDVNPTTGNVVEPYMRLPGGRVIYSDDLRKGGDGRTWTRTPRAAVEEDRSRGINPKWATSSAAVNRTMFTPTERYRENYARAFGHD